MKRLWIYGIFLLPALLVFTLFLIYPVVSSFYYSLTEWNGVALTPRFIGLDNFRELWADQDVWGSLSNTFHIAILLTLAQNGLGLILALCLQGTRRIYRWLRV